MKTYAPLALLAAVLAAPLPAQNRHRQRARRAPRRPGAFRTRPGGGPGAHGRAAHPTSAGRTAATARRCVNWRIAGLAAERQREDALRSVLTPEQFRMMQGRMAMARGDRAARRPARTAGRGERPRAEAAAPLPPERTRGRHLGDGPAWCLRGGDRYCTAFTMSKIGRYIATIMPPTTTPRNTIMIGSMRDEQRVDRRVDLVVVEVGDLGQHLVESAGLLADGDHRDHHRREHAGLLERRGDRVTAGDRGRGTASRRRGRRGCPPSWR